MTRFLITAILVGGGLNLAAMGALAQETPRERPSFAQLDTDGNGEITPDEMQARGDMRFGRIDTDGSGTLSKDELVAAAAQRAERRADRMLAQLDTDGDNVLSPDEMRTTRQGNRTARMFERVDTDGSGSISEAEFDAAAQRMQERRSNKG